MIKTLGTRYPELGRIRLGEKGQKGQPVKGEHLRFSSNDDVVLKALASQLGGTVERWEKGEQDWHLTTESDSVDVYLPPDPIDTAYELWSRAGCSRRCDGERCTFLNKGPDGEFMDTADCLCLIEGRTPGDRKDEGACNVTVRLRLVIPDVPGVGVWICTSHSVYAAMELPGQGNVLAAAGAGGGLIPATFAIEKRSEKKPYEKYRRDYIVPVLRVRKSLAQLVTAAANGELVGGQASVGNGSRPALESGNGYANEGASDDAAGGKAHARTADAHSEPGEAHGPDHHRAEPADERAPREGGSRASGKPVGGSAGSPPNSPVFIRAITSLAKRMWTGVAEGDLARRLDAIVEEVTEGRTTTFAALSGPADANAVLAELNRIAEAAKEGASA